MKVSTLILSNGCLWINVPLDGEEFEEFREELLRKLAEAELPVASRIRREDSIFLFDVFTDLSKKKIERLANKGLKIQKERRREEMKTKVRIQEIPEGKFVVVVKGMEESKIEELQEKILGYLKTLGDFALTSKIKKRGEVHWFKIIPRESRPGLKEAIEFIGNQY